MTTGLRVAAATVCAVALSVAATPAMARVSPPPAAARADYQLGGAYTPASGVKIVTRDRTDRPAPGRYSICYVNAFQTQPHETRWWLRNRPRLLLRDARGTLIRDAAWNEVLLDISAPAKRAAIARIVGRWIAGCAWTGFQAIEPDNLDSYTRSRGRLLPRHAVAFSRLLTQRAHRAGLAIAQKNAAELSHLRRRIGFDFAVAEECQAYGECGRYLRFYNRRVIEIEYPDNGGTRNFRAACAARGATISLLYRDRNLSRQGARGYRAAWCG